MCFLQWYRGWDQLLSGISVAHSSLFAEGMALVQWGSQGYEVVVGLMSAYARKPQLTRQGKLISAPAAVSSEAVTPIAYIYRHSRHVVLTPGLS